MKLDMGSRSSLGGTARGVRSDDDSASGSTGATTPFSSNESAGFLTGVERLSALVQDMIWSNAERRRLRGDGNKRAKVRNRGEVIWR